MSTDTLARAFVDAAANLGTALGNQLAAQDPEMAAKVAAVLTQGERLVLSMEFDPAAPAIRLATVDDYGTRREVMHIPAASGRRQ